MGRPMDQKFTNMVISIKVIFQTMDLWFNVSFHESMKVHTMEK